MKFCRFELLEDPGVARTGIAYEGRIFETDGTNSIGVHEAQEIRLLPPIGRPSTVRLFRPGELAFDYLNPMVVFGPNETLLMPPHAERIGMLPALAVVVGGAGARIPVAQADDVVLGVGLANVFTTLRDHGGRAFDVGTAVGPAITTPDEFAEISIRPGTGMAYEDEVTILRNGHPVVSYQLSEAGANPAQAIAHASESCPVAEGDLILLALGDPVLALEPGEEVRLASARVGVLATRLAVPEP